MIVSGINKVSVIGAGTMGIQIGLHAARAGYQVTVYDISEKVLAEVVSRHQ